MAANDDQLILRICNHDLSAFDELYEKYQTAVYRFAYYLTQNQTEADDLFQETWLRAVRFLTNNPSVRDFKAWILTIAINLHRDQLRRKKIRRLFGFERSITPEEVNKHCADFAGNADFSQVAAVEISHALNAAITALPLKQRQIFCLKEIEGFKHSEISQMLKLPIGTIKSLLHRAIKKLQQQLADYRNS